MPDIFFATQDEIPEELRGAAKAGEDGRFAVNVVLKEKLDEFRNTNIGLRKEFDGVKAFKDAIADVVGEDPVAFKTSFAELQQIAQRVKDGQLVENKGLEEAVAERTKEMKRSLETQLATVSAKAQTLETTNKDLETRLRRTIIGNKISAAALDEKLGVQKSAVEDIAALAEQVFTIEDDGTLVPKKGGATLYGSDGITPMTPAEWISSLKESKPHLFQSSTGGGGTGGDKKFGGFSVADVAKMTPQQKLELANSQGFRR